MEREAKNETGPILFSPRFAYLTVPHYRGIMHLAYMDIIFGMADSIGNFGHVAGERGQHGLMGMVLSVGALIGKQAVATLQTAMIARSN